MKKIKTIALVAPCGKIKDIDELNKKISILEKKFKIKKYYSENSSHPYLSDSEENRIKYFENAFLDFEADLVLNIRGGFGALKIVDKLNYQKLKNIEKSYASSSDGTILLSALYKNTKINCFHSLMLTNGFLDNLEENIKIIENKTFNLTLEPLNNIPTKGILWGGNLSSIVSMLSAEAFIPDRDIILFLEDLNEPLYKIDKMLYEIYRCEKLKKRIKGLIFGDFYLEENVILPLINEYLKRFNVGGYRSINITHKKNNITIPIGKFLDLC